MKKNLVMKDVKITEVKSGSGKIAIFSYTGPDDPVCILDEAICLYTRGSNYTEFIDISMDNPLVRVIISNVDDVMEGSVDFNDIVGDIRLGHLLRD